MILKKQHHLANAMSNYNVYQKISTIRRKYKEDRKYKVIIPPLSWVDYEILVESKIIKNKSINLLHKKKEI